MTTEDPQLKISVESYQLFITFVFSVSIFGASTFAVIAGQMADPADVWKPAPPPFSLRTVRNFLAVAWLCFILAIAVAGYSSSILTLHRQRAGGAYRRDWAGTWKWQGILASVALHTLLIAAFLFLSLALVAYVGAVGWVAVGFCGLAAVFVIVLSILQWRQT
jgi:hypothetical protein